MNLPALPTAPCHASEPQRAGWYQVAYASNEPSGREVRAHRCGSCGEVETFWDERVEPGDHAVEVTIKGEPVWQG